MAVFAACRFQPLAAVAHEIAEPSAVIVERGGEKGKVSCGQFSHILSGALAAQILNENQAEKERRDLQEKQIAEERQSVAAANAWQRSLRLTPTNYTRP